MLGTRVPISPPVLEIVIMRNHHVRIGLLVRAIRVRWDFVN